jgi:hypothetical protein
LARRDAGGYRICETSRINNVDASTFSTPTTVKQLIPKHRTQNNNKLINNDLFQATLRRIVKKSRLFYDGQENGRTGNHI